MSSAPPPSARGTRPRMLAAVVELLSTVPESDRVTITDVVTAAGVSRPTFYAAFEDLPDAFAQAALGLLADAMEGHEPRPVSADDRLEETVVAIREVLRRLEQHVEVFARVLRGPGGPEVQGRIVEFVAERLQHGPVLAEALEAGRLPASMTATGIAAGVVWLMIRWLQSSPREPIEDLAPQLGRYMEEAVFGGLGG